MNQPDIPISTVSHFGEFLCLETSQAYFAELKIPNRDTLWYPVDILAFANLHPVVSVFHLARQFGQSLKAIVLEVSENRESNIC